MHTYEVAIDYNEPRRATITVESSEAIPYETVTNMAIQEFEDNFPGSTDATINCVTENDR